MARQPLPRPSDCYWHEAEQVAEVLEAAASELRATQGPRPTGPRWGYLGYLVDLGRWQGRNSAAIHLNHLAMGYRLRQAEIRKDER